MAQTQAQIQAEIDAIDAKLNEGVTQVDVDGTRTVYDLDALREQRRQLQNKLRSYSLRRPRASGIFLGGF